MMDVRLVATLKRAAAGVLYYSGLLWLYAAIRLRRRAVVLMYHRVLPSGADTYSHDGIIVRPETFARQMLLPAPVLPSHLGPEARGSPRASRAATDDELRRNV